MDSDVAFHTVLRKFSDVRRGSHLWSSGVLFPWSEKGNSQDAFGFMKETLNVKNQYYMVNLPDKI